MDKPHQVKHTQWKVAISFKYICLISNIGTEDKEVTKNVSNGQRWMYAKFLGLTLIDAIVGADNSDEIVQDIYLYASSQHSLSGVYYKLTWRINI